MRRVFALLLLLTSGGAAASDGTVTGFYQSLLARGHEAYARGAFAEALKLLRIAAFGSVDDIPSYERANIYIALASDRLGDKASATAAMIRIAAAERISPSFASLDIGDDSATFASLSRRYGISLPPPADPSQARGAVGEQTHRAAPPAAPQAARTPPASSMRTRAPASSTAPPAAPAEKPARTEAPAPRRTPARPTEGTETAAETKPPAPLPAVPAAGQVPKPAAPDASATGPAGAIPREEFALQVAIACEDSTVSTLRERLEEVVLVPQLLGTRRCNRVLTGRYASREEAASAVAAIRKRARTSDDPIVVVRPPGPSASGARPR